MAKNYELNFKLTNFIDARIIESADDNGVMELGVFIPMEKNALRVNSHNDVLCTAFVTERLSNTGDNSTHYIRQKTDRAHVAKLNALGYKTPYLGRMWPQHSYKPRFQDNVNTQRVKADGYADE